MSTHADKVVNRRPYVQKQSRWWWLRNPFYIRYMVREGTSIFVLLYSLSLMTGLWCLSLGDHAWNEWLNSLQHPVFVVFHLGALAAAMYHAYTWFQLAPKIMQLRVGDWTLPEKAMLIGQWLGFIVCSVALLFIALFLGR